LLEADPAAEGLALGTLPGLAPQLLLPGAEDLALYRARGGAVPGLRGEALIRAVEAAGLRGRGGAGFPAAVKLATLRAAPGPKFVVANGEEGEPASVKDRWLMRRRPHLVIDGLLCAAEAIGATEAFLYVSDPWSASSLRAALAELGATPLPVQVVEVAPGYVAGEETSVIRALGGGPAKPTDKPPRPYEAGLHGRPTLVSNVETLAHLPGIATGRSTAAAILLTLTGAVARPGLYEVPLGTRLGTVLERLAGLRPGCRGLLMGGFFAGLLNTRALDLPLTQDALKAAGSGLGCGAVIAIGEQDCPIAAAGDVMAYFARENAGQCGACFRGTPAMAKAIAALGLGTIDEAGVEKLRDWSVSLRGRGACGTLDGAAHLAATIFREFPEEVVRHRAEPCPRCQALLPAGATTRFRAGTPHADWKETP
jgi:NADH:ubiquinone oxidoreductase subunit F (NADH-binding)